MNWYDWRDRLVATKQGDQGPSEDTTTHRPIVINTYDNLNEKTSVEQFDGDQVTIAVDSDGVPIIVTSGTFIGPEQGRNRAETDYAYDEVGQVYQTTVWDFDTEGASHGTLVTNYYRDLAGQVIAQSNPGGLWTKTTYDGAGRAIVVYQTDGAGGSDLGPGEDNVLQQTETQYDGDGNAILVITRQRFHDETALGPLQDPNNSPKARVYYVANYYDALNRPTSTVNVGTNGGVAWSRPGSPPTPSGTVLVTSKIYRDFGPAGWEDLVTDPRGIVNVTCYDNLGRTIETIANYQTGSPTNTSDQTTEFGYDGDNNRLFVQVDLPGNAVEKTAYQYGGNNLTNDMLYMVQYPDRTTGEPSTNPNQQVTYTDNNLGQITGMTDRNGTVHEYSFDVLGRQTFDTIKTFGAGVDQTVGRIGTAYDTYGNAYLFTTYRPNSNIFITSQVLRTFNGLGQMTAEYQSHSSTVSTSGSYITPSVRYIYNEMSGGANNSRLVSITYPNGRVITYNYVGLDATISRVSSISDSSGTLEQDSYLGLGTVVSRTFPGASNVTLSYVQQPGDTLANKDGGDQYTGLDRFGRVIDQRWFGYYNGSSQPTSVSRVQYDYDPNSNPTVAENLINSGFSEVYTSDRLNQLSSFARGTLDISTDSQGQTSYSIPDPDFQQTWTTDALGNWLTKNTIDVTNGPSSYNASYNYQNQIVKTNSGGATTPTYDNNGNMTGDLSRNVITFDAWNHQVSIQTNPNVPDGTTVTYAYDALGRRVSQAVSSYASSSRIDLYLNQNGQVIEERTGSTPVTATPSTQYVYSPAGGNLLTERDDQPVQGSFVDRVYVLQDPNGSVTALVRANSGNVVERYVYDGFGQVTILTANWTTFAAPYQGTGVYNWQYFFQAGRRDPLTGAYHFGDRDMDPSSGHWEEQDPLGFGGGDDNLYRFVGNDPGKYIDPSGDIPLFIIGLGVWAVSWALQQWSGAIVEENALATQENRDPAWWTFGISDTGARWMNAAGVIGEAVGQTMTFGGGISSLAGFFGISGRSLLVAGGLTTLWQANGIMLTDRSQWGAPEYVGAIGSLLAPWGTGYLMRGNLAANYRAGANFRENFTPNLRTRWGLVCNDPPISGDSLPDDANVIRGGINTPELIARGTGTHPSGVVGISVESAPGLSVEELAIARQFRNSQIGATTAGRVRAAGGDVIPTSGRSPNHATLTGLDPETASQLFQPPIPNPARRP